MRASKWARLVAAFGLLMSLTVQNAPAAAQLAPAPWPIFHHDVQHSGQSDSSGPTTAIVRWRYPTERQVHSSPATDLSGTTYFGTTGGQLIAVIQQGMLQWSYQTGGAVDHSSPAIAVDGTIYVGSNDKYIYAINSDGTLKWRYQTGDLVNSSSPAIGADGTVYLGSWDHYLYALNPDGTLQWRYQTGDIIDSSPALGVDGTVYVGSYDRYLYALNPDGSLQWRFPTAGWIHSSPSVGSDGAIYFGSFDNYLYALESDGSLRWRSAAAETGFGLGSSPSVGLDGTVSIGSTDKFLYAFNPDGSIKFRYQTGGVVHSSPAMGADGSIYAGSFDKSVYALNASGSLTWRYETGNYVTSSPAIAFDGTILIGSDDNSLYAFGPGQAPARTMRSAPGARQVGAGQTRAPMVRTSPLDRHVRPTVTMNDASSRQRPTATQPRTPMVAVAPVTTTSNGAPRSPCRGGTTLDVTGNPASHNDVGSWDFVCRSGQITAMVDGTVRFVQSSVPDGLTYNAPSLGNVVWIDGTDGFCYLAGHLRQGSISVGQGYRAAHGEKIGLMGHSGWAFGDHVHVNRMTGCFTYVDPKGYRTAWGTVQPLSFADLGTPPLGTYTGGNYIDGDIDRNGIVDIFDYNRLVENFGRVGCGNPADLDGNCRVDIFDYNIIVGNFGKRAF